MEKEFVPYELALELKTLGFDEPCFKCKVIGEEHLDYTPSDYDDFPEQKEVEVLIPTFSQAFRWFDENTQLKGFVVPSIKEEHFDWLIRIDWEEEIECEEAYTSRIQAELACLEKLIEIVKYK